MTNCEEQIKEITPKSPVPFIEETIGAFFCLTGVTKTFPWRGTLYTFSKGLPVKVLTRLERKIRETFKGENIESFVFEKDKNIVFIETAGKKLKYRVKEVNGSLFFERMPVKPKKEKCKYKCQYNLEGACKYDPLEAGETGCEDPIVEMQKLNSTGFMDLI